MRVLFLFDHKHRDFHNCISVPLIQKKKKSSCKRFRGQIQVDAEKLHQRKAEPKNLQKLETRKKKKKKE